MTETRKRARDRLDGVRVTIAREHPFFACLALGMKWHEDQTVPVIATDGETVRYNPDAILEVPAGALLTTVARCVMHPALMHLHRVQDVAQMGGDRARAQVAAAYAANCILADAGFNMTAQSCHNPRWRDRTLEAIYHDIPGGFVSRTGEGSDILPPAPKVTPADAAVRFTQAAQAARAQGNCPANIERMIKDLLEPRADWRSILREHLTASMERNDYTFSHPNRRYAHTGFFLPSLRGESIGPVVWFCDTSGSRSDENLRDAISELDGLRQTFPCEVWLVWIDCQDVADQHVQYFGTHDPVEPRPYGGGGTDFRPAFRWLDDQGLDPSVVIYHTDMWGTFPDEDPGYPVLWLSDSSAQTAPFGTVIDMRR